ncbi:hypothetical protein [Okeania sp. SIO1F9]|uniref:hypothetical protein n=1 Tax=Okeania sp. SIO1F9 TaxID=2607813 RepID=UPI00144BF498|nr:hypothetical protein [Okeania sp. SIO1F9]NET76450.1 hypothetical protein [Okeania sp. SIO1F9]
MLNKCIISQESGVRSQETGDRGQETGDRRQESGVRKKFFGDFRVRIIDIIPTIRHLVKIKNQINYYP